MSNFLDKTGLTSVRSAIDNIYTRKDSISNKGATLSNGNAITIASVGGKNITVTMPRQPLYICNVNNGNVNNYKYHRFASIGSKANPITGSYIDYDMILSIRQYYNTGGYGIVKLSLRKNDQQNVSACSAQWLVRNKFKKDAIKIGLVNSPTGTFADVFFEAPHTYIRVEIAAIQVNSSFNLINTRECDNTTTTNKLTSYEVYKSIDSACTELHGSGSTYTDTISSVDMDVNLGNTYVNSLQASGRVYGTYMIAECAGPYIQLQNTADIDGDNKYNSRIISYSHSTSNDGALLDIGLYRNGYDYRTLRIKSLDSNTNVISLCEMRGGTAANHTFESFELWGRHNIVPVANGGTGASTNITACNNIGASTVVAGVEIPSNANLNTYTNVGSYRSTSSTVSKTLSNTPYTETGFKLEVFNTTSANQIIQEIKCNSDSCRTYRRKGNCASNVWTFGTWYQVIQTTDGVVPISQGGTGANIRSQASVNLVGLGTNPVATETDDTTAKWGALGFGQAMMNPDSEVIKPQYATNENPYNGYNLVLNVTSGRSSEVFQLSHNQPSGALYHRSGNGNGWNGNSTAAGSAWKCLLDTSNYTTWLVPKTGGTFTGAITATSFTATSDARLKTNIKDYNPAANILDLPVKEFDYIETGEHSIGCIAQDLQKMFPELVHEGENGYLSVNEGKLVYLLLLKVKELESLIKK